MEPSGALENLAAVAPGNLAPVPPPPPPLRRAASHSSGAHPAATTHPAVNRLFLVQHDPPWLLMRCHSLAAERAGIIRLLRARSERRPPIDDAPDLPNCFCSSSLVAFGEPSAIECPCSISEELGTGPGALPPLCAPADSRAVKADLSKCCFRYENTPTIPRP